MKEGVMDADFDMGNDSFDSSYGEGEDVFDVVPEEVADTGQLDEALDEAFPQDVSLVGETEVTNFDESGLTDSTEVVDYIGGNIPSDHLEGLESIEYINDQEAYEAGLMGMWEQDQLTGESAIDVYPHDDKGEMYDTIAHEIGHNAYSGLTEENPAAIETWNGIYEQSMNNYIESGGEQDEFVSPYAMTSPEEDFAESYATSINDPPLMQATSPDKYDFMETNLLR
jgi:hypothetical protein